MFKKIRSTIRNKLTTYFTQLLDINKIKNTIEDGDRGIYKELYEISKNANLIEQDIVLIKNELEELVSVGADIYPYRNHGSNDRSWAVVCVGGKLDYVRFIDLGRQEITYLRDFLRQFEYSRRVIDCPYPQMFDFKYKSNMEGN